MADTKELKRAIDALWLASDTRNRIPGRLGRKNTDGTTTVRVSERPGYVYARLGPEGNQGLTIAFNAHVRNMANLPIWMRRLGGRLVVMGVDYYSGRLDAFMSSASRDSYAVGTHTHKIGTGLEYEIEALRFEKGRVRYHSGLEVYITSFRYQKADGSWETWPGATLDLTSYQPSTSGHWAWVLVGIDPSDNTAIAVKGTEYPVGTPLANDLIDDISFSGYIPLGAVKVKEDDTDLGLMSRYADAHEWFALGGINRPLLLDASTILTISSGAVTATSDYHIIAAESGTADDLDTITAASNQQLLLIQADVGDTITVKHGTDNIQLNTGVDFDLTADVSLLLFYDGTNWSDIGTGGGLTVYYQTVEDDASGQTQRGKLNFADGTGIDFALSDDAGNDRTTVTPSLDINGLTEDTEPEPGADYLATYDDSATATKKTLVDNIIGKARLLFTQTEDKTVGNTTDETTILGGGYGTVTLAANQLEVGTQIRITGAGYLSDNGTPTLNIKCTLDGGEVVSTGATTLNSGVSGVGFIFEIIITCRTLGATGSVVTAGLFEYDDGTQVNMVKTATTTIDTTGILPIDVTTTWGTAHASNTITNQVGMIIEHRPYPNAPALVETGLALETGDALLLESGDRLLLE